MTTSPSTGITSPGTTRTRSPGRSASRSTVAVIGTHWRGGAVLLPSVFFGGSDTTSVASKEERGERSQVRGGPRARARLERAPEEDEREQQHGSSKKSLFTGIPYSPTTGGVSAPATDSPNAAVAPTPTSEFMFGAPMDMARNPRA